MKEIMCKGEKITILEASGYHDGYYWDMNAMIEFRGETYQLYDAGSGSGYIPCCSAITKYEFDRLYGEEQSKIDEDDWDYVEDTIIELLNNFIDSGAESSWESYKDDDWHIHILVDDEEVNNEKEEAQ